MYRMLNLVQNENMKIYLRARTWLMMAILVVLVFAVTLITFKYGGSSDDQNWRSNLQAKINAQQSQLELNEGMPEPVKRQIEQEIVKDQYMLDHDIKPGNRSIWGLMKDMSTLISLVTLFTIIIAAESVAGEFSWGTIKLLLIRPVTRSKILLSKYLASLIFAFVLLILLLIASFIAGGIFYGFGGIGIPNLSFDEAGQIIETSMLNNVIYTYVLNCASLVMLVTFAFMISTVFRGSSLAIGLSIFILFTGTSVAFMLGSHEWIKYFLFANTDLTQYVSGTPLRESMTMGFSLTVLAVYFVIFNAISWYVFNKRDVAA